MLDNKNILIVEDNSMNRVIYRMILEKVGAHLMFVSNTQMIFLQLQSKPWDLLILDLDLSYDNNGYTVFPKIRDMPQYSLLPIVGVSSHSVSVVLPKAQKLGFNGFIAKPINQHFFAHQLAQVIAGGEVWNSFDYLHQ